MAKKVSLQKFAAILRVKADELKPAAVLGVRKAALRLVVLIEHEIRNNTPYPLVDRGRMVADTQVTMIPDGAIVRNNAPYAAAQNWGARPFTPPRQVLLEWAIRKGFADPEGASWAIWQKFRKEGMKPKRFFERALAAFAASNTLSVEVHRALAERNKKPEG